MGTTRQARFDNAVSAQRLREIVKLVARAEGPMPLAVIADEVDLKDTTCLDYMRQLRKEGLVHPVGTNHFWRPGPDAAWFEQQRNGDGPVVATTSSWPTGLARRDPLVAALFGPARAQAEQQQQVL